MGIQKNIGKNTIGDNNKISVSLHDYNMSTHDLSTIVRDTQSPGTLVPNLCLVAQKGDTFDIDIDSNVLTHPTTGPLFIALETRKMFEEGTKERAELTTRVNELQSKYSNFNVFNNF